MRLIHLFLLFTSLMSLSNYAQNIRGVVIDTLNTPVANATVLIFDTENKTQIKSYCITDKKGYFTAPIIKNKKHLFIKINHISFIPFKKNIDLYN